jgi:sortase (surface protein transpeptidase)
MISKKIKNSNSFSQIKLILLIKSMNQSYTFKMLNRWIEDSETRELLKPRKDEDSSQNQNENNNDDEKKKKPFLNSEVAKLLQEEELIRSRQQAPKIQIQRQASIDSPKFLSPSSVPSRTFKQLDKAYNNDANELNTSKGKQ